MLQPSQGQPMTESALPLLYDTDHPMIDEVNEHPELAISGCSHNGRGATQQRRCHHSHRQRLHGCAPERGWTSVLCRHAGIRA